MAKTKVTIIAVDLGASVDDIIAESVAELTGQAKVELDQAMGVARETQRVRIEREQAAQAATDKLTTAMNAAYDALINASSTGLPVSSVMAIVADAVPNSSAFTLRMKHILAEKGNPYILERKKIHGTPHYVFTPFNQTPSA